MKAKFFLVGAILTFFLASIITIFWYQEHQYLLPTPVPSNYSPVLPGQQVSFTYDSTKALEKPVVLHFFNPDCPCSRFNIKHFEQLITRYRKQFDFYAVLQVEDTYKGAERFKEKYELDIPVVVDQDKKLAIACGVYSTPQAAIIDKQGKLYYRGNYNKTRYCTDPDSNFAQMAMDSLLAEKPVPVFIELATQSYGCELPGDVLN